MARGGIIILDGPDGAGKTTLAQRMGVILRQKGFQYVYVHLSKPEKGKCWQEHRQALLEYAHIANNGGIVVADRHFLSEAIYGDVYRDGSEYPLAARHVDRFLHRYGALRIICAPPVEYIRDMHAKLKKQRDEMYDSGMEDIAQRYLDLWHGACRAELEPTEGYVDQLTWTGGVADKLGWYHYDVTRDGADAELPNFIEKMIYELSIIVSLIPDMKTMTPNWTGWPRRGSVLLVGDCISEKSECKVPFMDNQGSSLFLARALHSLRIDESRVCMVNINDPDGPQMTRRVLPWCGRTIVMGHRAEQTMEREKLTYHAYVRHPQHARRFNHNDDTYAEELRVAFHHMSGVVEPCPPIPTFLP